jgi:hypothetical protein
MAYFHGVVQPACRALTPGSRAFHGIDAENAHVYFNGGGYTTCIMQPSHRLHYDGMQDACARMQLAYHRVQAAYEHIQPACSQHYALVKIWFFATKMLAKKADTACSLAHHSISWLHFFLSIHHRSPAS